MADKSVRYTPTDDRAGALRAHSGIAGEGVRPHTLNDLRRIVGWAMETHLRTELIIAALDMALAQRYR